MNINNDVRLLVDGQEWVGWTDVYISAGIERIARDFNVMITRQWPGDETALQIRPRIDPGASVQVFIGNDSVVTGYVDAMPVKYDALQVSVGIVGRSKTEDLIDCSATTKQFTGRSLIQIASQLSEPFSISVIDAGIDNKPLQGVQVDFGETVMEVINKLLGQQQVLAYDDENGNLVFGPVGAERAVTGLVLGENIRSCDTEKSIKERFSVYTTAGQRAGNDNDFGAATTNAIRARTVDEGVTRYRPMVIKQTGNATTGSCGNRCHFEMNRRAARTDEVTYTVAGWRQGNGELWRPNMIVNVFDPFLGFNNTEMLIAEVSYKKGAQGTTTELRVGPTAAYLPEVKS